MSDYDNILKMLSGVLKSPPKTSSYDTTATVVRIEDGVAWVHIDGGVDETPVRLTVAAQTGDTVQIRIGGGSAWITGNGTRPPTDDGAAIDAREIANGAVEGLKIQQAEIDRLKAQYIETLFIASPDYSAEDIPYLYPSTSTYPSETAWSSDGVNVLRGFAIDLKRGLILGAFYQSAIADLEARVTALEQENAMSLMSSINNAEEEE